MGSPQKVLFVCYAIQPSLLHTLQHFICPCLWSRGVCRRKMSVMYSDMISLNALSELALVSPLGRRWPLNLQPKSIHLALHLSPVKGVILYIHFPCLPAHVQTFMAASLTFDDRILGAVLGHVLACGRHCATKVRHLEESVLKTCSTRRMTITVLSFFFSVGTSCRNFRYFSRLWLRCWRLDHPGSQT